MSKIDLRIILEVWPQLDKLKLSNVAPLSALKELLNWRR